MRHSARVCVMVLAWTVVLGPWAAAQFSDKVLIQGARIIPVVGDELAKGSILIENGKITAIGVDVKAPFDARVVDATDKVVFPGMIDAMTSRGLDIANENIDVGPFLHVFDALDPSDRVFEEALRHGLTSLHVSQGEQCVITGVSRVVRPIGIEVREMTVLADAGLMICFSPKRGFDHSVQLAVLREAFDELDRYLDQRAEELYEKEQKKKDEEVTVPPSEARKLGRDLLTLAKLDDKHRNLERLRRGRLDAYLYCRRAMDVPRAIAFAEEKGFLARSTFVIGAECHKVAAELAKTGRPVILPADQIVYRDRDRITMEDKDVFVPKVLHDKKVPFAIADTSEPWYEAARCVRNGVPREAALGAVTLNAARAINMGHRVGSLEVGKEANLLVLTGDPLGTTTWIESVFIEGREVYERAKDLRLRDVIQGIFDTAEGERKKAEEARKALEEKQKQADGKDADKAAKDEASKNGKN